MSWLLTSVAEPMLIANAEGEILMVNGAVESLFGFDQGALAGGMLSMLLPMLESGAEAGGIPTGLRELSGRRQDGVEFPVEVHFSHLRTHWGLPLVLATIQDVTSRKQAEQALLDGEARVRAIVDTAVDAIITIDQNGLIERMNPAAIRLFGYSEEEARGRNVSMLMPSPYREQHDGYLRRYAATGEKRIIGRGREVVGQRRDGSCFPMDLAVAEMRIGSRRMYTGMVRDISERKRAEAEVASLLAKLTRANEDLTSFAYVVSHDLKAPLRGISALTDWITTDYADRLDDQGRLHLRQLSERVSRMGALIDGILEYSRVGRGNEAPERIDLLDVIREIIDSLHPPPRVTITVDPGLPVVKADRTQMHQVFQNLIANAIQYMDKESGDIRIVASREGADWVIAVSDNGIGIEARHLERIFLLFQTIAPKQRPGGTGVGLALVKKIVEMYGGRLSVRSEPGVGSTFSFTIPGSLCEQREAR